MTANKIPQNAQGQPPTPATLDRITELDSLMHSMACLWSFRTGADADDLYSSFHFHVTEHAMLCPDFLDTKHNANFIVTYGVRQTINNHRRRKSHDVSAHAQSLDEDGVDEWLGYTSEDFTDAQPDASAVAANVLNQLADVLDETGQAVLGWIRNHGDKAYKCNGKLNVNRIATETGLPQRTVCRRVQEMQQVLGGLELRN